MSLLFDKLNLSRAASVAAIPAFRAFANLGEPVMLVRSPMTRKVTRVFRSKGRPGGVQREPVLLDDPDTERRQHIGVKPRARFQVLGDDTDMIEHALVLGPSRQFDRMMIDGGGALPFFARSTRISAIPSRSLMVSSSISSRLTLMHP